MVPEGLESGGEALWLGLTAGVTLSAPQRVLVLEACRITDRLDRMDRQLADREVWMELVLPYEGADVVSVTMDKALLEARQQALTLRQILVTLGVGALAQKPSEGGGFLDELERRRANRESNPASS